MNEGADMIMICVFIFGVTLVAIALNGMFG